mmetsp:Transcript_9634/g.19391  ORF Transcript_9634/g.19391 Transcript_9634/m.19391 type:complete len:207 (-) Transcript_9634:3-623(-)
MPAGAVSEVFIARISPPAAAMISSTLMVAVVSSNRIKVLATAVPPLLWRRRREPEQRTPCGSTTMSTIWTLSYLEVDSESFSVRLSLPRKRSLRACLLKHVSSSVSWNCTCQTVMASMSQSSAWHTMSVALIGNESDAPPMPLRGSSAPAASSVRLPTATAGSCSCWSRLRRSNCSSRLIRQNMTRFCESEKRSRLARLAEPGDHS